MSNDEFNFNRWFNRAVEIADRADKEEVYSGLVDDHVTTPEALFGLDGRKSYPQFKLSCKAALKQAIGKLRGDSPGK